MVCAQAAQFQLEHLGKYNTSALTSRHCPVCLGADGTLQAC
jgi:hypothetical protein